MKTYFVSGHRYITNAEFQEHYIPKLYRALYRGPCEFVVGDYQGVDSLAQRYLKGAKAAVTVYHMFTNPRNNIGDHPTKGGYKNDIARDSAMTKESDEDIAWVRKGQETSGTAQNVDRRKKYNERL